MILTAVERAFLEAARRATLATIDGDGRARLVPICFVMAQWAAAGSGHVLYSPLDEKRKSVADPLALARVRDIIARPGVSLLVDRWSEDWSRLGWLRIHGQASLVPAGAAPAAILDQLRTKYPAYLDHRLEERPGIAIIVERASAWGDLNPD